MPLVRAQVPQNTRRLIEPFVGSGAVALNLGFGSSSGSGRNLLSDANTDLIAVFRELQRNPHRFIAACAREFTPANNTADAYYRRRAEFNASRDPVRRACLFVYLNRHGYNGLCRYNACGEFNVPFGRHARPYFPCAEMRQFATRLHQVRFVCADFREILAQAGAGDFVYCDPPYCPAGATARFAEYAPGGFSLEDHRDLARHCRATAHRGACVVISNHDTAFTRRLYRDATSKMSLTVPRTISRRGDGRKPARELLVIYRPC